MVSEQVRNHLRHRPFKPFELNLADGRQLTVRHPEFIYVPPKNERTIFVTAEDGEVETVDVLLVVSLKPLPSGHGQGGANGQSNGGQPNGSH